LKSSNNHMPRERLLAVGAPNLSETELIAILLRTGTKGMDVMALSSELLKKYGSLSGLLSASYEELAKFKGIGEAKAVTLKAALEIGHRVFKELTETSKTKIADPESVYYLCHDMTTLTQEMVRVISLNNKLMFSGMNTITIGTLDSSLLHPREVFKPAISKSAAAIILVHNHPSGDPNPSKEDEAITKRLKEAGETLGIKLLDHVIIGKGRYYSFASKKETNVSEVRDDFQRIRDGARKERDQTRESYQAYAGYGSGDESIG